MQPSSSSTTLRLVEPLAIVEAWSGETKFTCQPFELARPEDTLLDVAQGLVHWCKDSVRQWLSLWLQQRFGAVVVDEPSPTVLQQLDVILDSFAELKRQQQVIYTALEGLRCCQQCCCEGGNRLETPRTLNTMTTTRRSATQDNLLIVKEIDDYVELNFQDIARGEQESMVDSEPLGGRLLARHER